MTANMQEPTFNERRQNRRDVKRNRGPNIIGQAFQGLAVSVGLASEAIQHSKDKKRAKQLAQDPASSNPSNDQIAAKEDPTRALEVGITDETDDQSILSYQSTIPAVDDDFDAWTLQEGFEDSTIAAGNENENNSTDEIDTQVRSTMSLLTEPLPNSRLSAPVVIPQRRPGTRTRGFVKAYAPVLQASGIGQEAFLSFLKDMHKGTQASPIFNAIIIAANIAGMAPSIIATAVCATVMAGAQAAKAGQERWRANKFLDNANRDIFMPRGLYAMVVAFESKPADEFAQVSFGTYDMAAHSIVRYSDPSSGFKGKMQQFRHSSGQTDGEAGMPMTCAPLVFPASEITGTDDGKRTFKEKTKSSNKFVQDYFDRRAQASYAGENADTTLAHQMDPAKPRFTSRYADPNHPAASGNPIAFITGGKINLDLTRQSESRQKRGILGGVDVLDDRGGRANRGGLAGRRRMIRRNDAEPAEQRVREDRPGPSKPFSGIQRMLKSGVLYLLIVNMPSEEELEAARAKLE